MVFTGNMMGSSMPAVLEALHQPYGISLRKKQK